MTVSVRGPGRTANLGVHPADVRLTSLLRAFVVVLSFVNFLPFSRRGQVFFPPAHRVSSGYRHTLSMQTHQGHPCHTPSCLIDTSDGMQKVRNEEGHPSGRSRTPKRHTGGDGTIVHERRTDREQVCREAVRTTRWVAATRTRTLLCRCCHAPVGPIGEPRDVAHVADKPTARRPRLRWRRRRGQTPRQKARTHRPRPPPPQWASVCTQTPAHACKQLLWPPYASWFPVPRTAARPRTTLSVP